MYPNLKNKFAQAYANNYVETAVSEATPYKLVKLLYEAGLKNVAVIKVFVQRKDMEKKSEFVSKLIGVLYGLRGGLDMQAGGDVAANLYALYDYLIRITFQASAKNDLEKFDEIETLLRDLADAWNQMPAQFQQLSQNQLFSMRQKASGE
ncbi:flagellar export chaperone FliS [Thiomicrospira sp. R3]|uniref:flagellar export chaperone FliS n=1 Tax=Thiomicrospira sp. R3 TaxID=3035472 RepID=UPI00259B6003|nr:flagellar export chaperone FliS [Thiomicrospira sp. R3]WFE67941.1 flagellar export chaperone FliS [Thiomicrospira sp. R3]